MRLTRAESVVVVVVLALIGLLAIQPALIPRSVDRQAEFAWEVFAKVAPRDEFIIHSGDTRETVAVNDVQRPALANLDYTAHLPAHLCERYPGAERIEVTRSGHLMSTFECRR